MASIKHLFAKRVTASFEDNPWKKKSLHLAGNASATVLAGRL
jgi:hypothetical protein